MRLTPGVFAILVAVALVLLTVVWLDSVAPASCSDARKSLDHDLTAQAEKDFLSILAEEPDSECAANGIDEVVKQKCADANDQLENGLLAEAEKAYLAVLAERPAAPCARARLWRVITRRCQVADRFRAAEAVDEAKKAYLALLERPRPGPGCALRGLAALQKDEPSPAAQVDQREVQR